jgi:hypothetical protein
MNITCMKLTISYSGLHDASKGSHMGNIISWLVTMRAVVCKPWNTSTTETKFLVNIWMIGMYPACVILPVSVFMVGSSSHVKESVMVSRCSISRLR